MSLLNLPKKTVEQWLDDVNFTDYKNYIPTDFALNFLNTMKLIDGGENENKTPVLHLMVLDKLASEHRDVANLVFRGAAKSTLFEYLIFYIAIYGEIPHLKDINFILYVTDSIDNGVKTMKKNLEFRYQNSAFLQTMLPKANFTAVIWSFENADGKKLTVNGYGAKTGIRGTRVENRRPQLALLDDLISDDDARSETVIKSVEDTIYNALEYALHPTESKTIWSGTPFNARDPLYKAIESGAWLVNVYPVCKEFPCAKEDFEGAWDDRFTWEALTRLYNKALKNGKLAGFMQEMMLRIMSEEERLIPSDVVNQLWYSHTDLIDNIHNYNIYVTTDFAVRDTEDNDFSVILVWAVNYKGVCHIIDGICKRQTMDDSIEDLFRLCQRYQPLEVGIEISGQQYAFISWIDTEMIRRQVYFNIACEKNSKIRGFQATNKSNKFARFNLIVPWFNKRLIRLPLEKRSEKYMIEGENELSLVCASGFRSKHDDVADGISMLLKFDLILPSVQYDFKQNPLTDIWEKDDSQYDIEESSLNSYIV